MKSVDVCIQVALYRKYLKYTKLDSHTYYENDLATFKKIDFY